jgi:hypothetical protein
MPIAVTILHRPNCPTNFIRRRAQAF